MKALVLMPLKHVRLMEIISSVAEAVREFNLKLVVCPAMVVKSGARLLREEAVEASSSARPSGFLTSNT